jgi:hypothetical protein
MAQGFEPSMRGRYWKEDFDAYFLGKMGSNYNILILDFGAKHYVFTSQSGSMFNLKTEGHIDPESRVLGYIIAGYRLAPLSSLISSPVMKTGLVDAFVYCRQADRLDMIQLKGISLDRETPIRVSNPPAIHGVSNVGLLDLLKLKGDP